MARNKYSASSSSLTEPGAGAWGRSKRFTLSACSSRLTEFSLEPTVCLTLIWESSVLTSISSAAVRGCRHVAIMWSKISAPFCRNCGWLSSSFRSSLSRCIRMKVADSLSRLLLARLAAVPPTPPAMGTTPGCAIGGMPLTPVPDTSAPSSWRSKVSAIE